MMTPSPSGLLTPPEAAKFLRLKNPGTLAVWRTTKRYPLRYVKIGYRVFYKLTDLQAFIERRTVVIEARA
jgi:hypothetical protein